VIVINGRLKHDGHVKSFLVSGIVIFGLSGFFFSVGGQLMGLMIGRNHHILRWSCTFLPLPMDADTNSGWAKV
jgi:hypothetical protein